MTALYEKCGELFCKSLTGFHAITGCDFNPAFFRKGKLRPFKLLQNNEQFQNACPELGNINCDREKVSQTIEKFVCLMYASKTHESVDKLRFVLFLKSYKVDNVNES